MKAPLKSKKPTTEFHCRSEIERMLKNSQTKVIMPVVTFALLRAHLREGKTEFSDAEIKLEYAAAVKLLQEYMGHNVHFGAKYYDAYGNRMSRYSVLRPTGHLRYELTAPYMAFAEQLCDWMPARISQHINSRLGVVPMLGDVASRVAFAESRDHFLTLVREQIDKTPTNFEIFCFAVIKVHLEKFACKIYRDILVIDDIRNQ